MIAKPFVLQDKLHIAQKTQQPFQLRLMPRPAHLNKVHIELDAVGRQVEPTLTAGCVCIGGALVV